MSAEMPVASHSALTAIPFFLPTIIVIAVILVVVWRDRRRHPDDDETTGSEQELDPRHGGTDTG